MHVCILDQRKTLIIQCKKVCGTWLFSRVKILWFGKLR